MVCIKWKTSWRASIPALDKNDKATRIAIHNLSGLTIAQNLFTSFELDSCSFTENLAAFSVLFSTSHSLLARFNIPVVSLEVLVVLHLHFDPLQFRFQKLVGKFVGAIVECMANFFDILLKEDSSTSSCWIFSYRVILLPIFACRQKSVLSACGVERIEIFRSFDPSISPELWCQFHVCLWLIISAH